MIVGDGQQSIYPGGFGLREGGIGRAGRSRVLTATGATHRNVWTAAKAIIGHRIRRPRRGTLGSGRLARSRSPDDRGTPQSCMSWGRPPKEVELLAASVAERLDSGASTPAISRRPDFTIPRTGS